jgi:creatinine amidohydrolase
VGVLEGVTWGDVGERGRVVLAVPLGSTEQHGPHLPLDTDTRIAVELASRLTAARGDVVVAPALAYGSSGEHAGFPGTLSIGQEALERVLVELVRSVTDADGFAAGVVLVNGHGGNAEPLRRATVTLEHEGRRVLSWSPTVPGGDLHAGRTETSMLLALAPDVVRLDRAAPGAQDVDLERLRRDGVRAVSPNGVLGDPTGASAEEGVRLLDAMTADLVSAVAAWMA